MTLLLGIIKKNMCLICGLTVVLINTIRIANPPLLWSVKNKQLQGSIRNLLLSFRLYILSRKKNIVFTVNLKLKLLNNGLGCMYVTLNEANFSPSNKCHVFLPNV